MQRRFAMLFLAGLFTASSAFATDAGDPERGAKVWKKCKACHQIGDDAKHKIGPHLNEIYGRTAGSLDDFKFSESMTESGASGLVWTAETLDMFLIKPKGLVKKTKMTFGGLKKPQDRADILAFLQTHSPEVTKAAVEDPEVTLAPEVLAIAGDPEYGEYLASECLTCHKADGAEDGMPSITGWPTEIFVIVMHSYKEKVRNHPVMQMMAGKLSNEEIAALAAYFEKLE